MLALGLPLSIAAQFYDYFVTFQREVELVWPSKWNSMKVLFIVSRYSPFLDVPLDVYCDSFVVL